MAVSRRTATVFLAAFLAVSVGVGAWAGEPLPDGLKGFSGQVRGVVIGTDDANVMGFKVARILRIWKGNKAEKPELILGRTVSIGPGWHQGDDGEFRPVELHVAFLAKLEIGQEVTLEIHNVEGDGFAILELSKDQRALAMTPGDEVGARELEARVSALEEDVAGLKAENAELRRKLELLQR